MIAVRSADPTNAVKSFFDAYREHDVERMAGLCDDMAGYRSVPFELWRKQRVIRGDGKVSTTDGPFAETREQLGGYYLIEAKNLDEAIGIAEQIPAANWGTIEIRPVMEITGLPNSYAGSFNLS